MQILSKPWFCGDDLQEKEDWKREDNRGERRGGVGGGGAVGVRVGEGSDGEMGS